MCLKPAPVRPMPTDIGTWGAKHLAAESPYRYVGDTLYSQWQEADFADLYHPEGKPALSPVLLALVTIFQRYEHLGDRAAVHAVRTRLDWKYALHLPLDDDGFDASVLCEFRQRLLDHNAEARLFDTVLTQLKTEGYFRQRGTQRTDSTHVLAMVRALNRIETVGETMRATLNAIAQAAPAWLVAHADAAWVDRYAARFDEGRLPETDAKRQALALQIGNDGYRLLAAIDAVDAPLALRDLPMVHILRQVWIQQFYQDAEQQRWRTPDELPPASVAINSPYDPEARYSSKHSTKWVGYKVHYSETCDDEQPRVITNVELTPAPLPDTEMTDTIHTHLKAADRLPATHLVDAGYVDAEHLVESQRDYQIDLCGPVPVESSWQARAKEGYVAADFPIDWEANHATCPQGHHSAHWKDATDPHGNTIIHVEFARAQCQACPVVAHCTHSTHRGRQLTIRPKESYLALQAARARQQTPAFKEQYAQRAGMEGTLSRGVRACGMRRSHYQGEDKTHFQELCIAAGINIARVAAHRAGIPPAPKRTPALVRVLTPALAPQPAVTMA